MAGHRAYSGRSRRILTVSVLAALAATLTWAMVGIPPFSVVDVGPDDSVFDPGSRNATSGGRVNGLAIDPSNDLFVYAASEWGGLFKSLDGASSWIQLDEHRPQATWDIAVDPGNTGTVYATSFYDGRIQPESGIQVSYDGGATWNRPASATPVPASLPGCNSVHASEPNAYGIGIQPDLPQNVFIGTDCGVATTTNSGVTWSHVTPTSQIPAPSGGGNNRVWDVFVQAGGIVDVCGVDGHHRFNGATWSGASGLPGGVCSIVVSPLEANVLFATVGGGLWESQNAGGSWTQVDDNGGGRIPTVQAISTGGNSFDLYWGSGVKLRRIGCDNSSANRCGLAGNLSDGPNLGSDITGSSHDDTGWVAFDSNSCPRYYSNDGGVFRNNGCPGISWGRAMSGMHSMWTWDLAGSTNVTGDSGPAVSFGLQDDGVWHTTDGTASWSSLNCCDGFDNEVDQDRSIFSVCCSFETANGNRLEIMDTTGGNRSTVAHPSGRVPTFQHGDAISQFAPQSYVLVTLTCNPAGTDPDGGSSSRWCAGTGAGGVFATTDEGANWTQLGAASTPGNACGVLASVSLGTPTFYLQSGNCNANAGGNGALWKYSGIASGGTWSPADPGLSDVGVYAVHPTNPNLLLASDQTTPTRMMSSVDGGLSWQPLPALDAIMTRGDFVMVTTRGPTDFTGFGGYHQPSLVHFHPTRDGMLLAGARDSGLFLSSDSGASWALVSEQVSRPFHAFFDTSNDDIYVGTVGRGVYRVGLPEADIGITKSDAPDPVHAGAQLFYTYSVTNFGPEDATGVTIIDALPPEVIFLTDDLGVCTELIPGTINCNLGNLAVGETAVLVVDVQVAADVVSNAGDVTSIQNTASVSSPGIIDGDPSNNEDTIGTIVDDLAELTVTKLCEPDREVPAGTEAICTVIVDNFGPSYARNVVVMDALASNGDFEIVGTPTASQGTGCFVWGNTWSCNLGILEPATTAETGRATVEVVVRSDDPVDIADLSRVVSATPDPDTSNNESSDVILVTAVADLSLLKGDAPDPVVAGENLTYTLSLQNSGPSSAENVVVTDTLPAGVTIVSVSGTGGATCNAGEPGDPFQPTTCNFGTLLSGGARSMTIVVTVDPDTLGDIINDARVSSDTFDDEANDDLASTTTTVEAEADLSVAKTDLQEPVVAGEILDYELTVINHGPSSARNVIITDVLPPELTFVNATVLDGSGECVLADPPTNTVECHIGEIPPNAGTPVFIEIKGLVAASTDDGTITNNASVQSTETPDSVPGNNAVAEDTEVVTVADLAIDKASNQDTYKPSSQVIYTVTVTNLGSSDAQNVGVTDVLPTAKHDFLFDTAGCAGGATGTMTCSLGTIPAGQSSAFNIHIKMKGNSGVISNTASVTSSTTDPDPLNNEDTLENLIAGGTGESGGGGPGPNATSPEDDPISLLAGSAICGIDDRSQMNLSFEWETSARIHKNRTVQVSLMSSFDARYTRQYRTTGDSVERNDRLATGTIYHWRVVGKQKGKRLTSGVSSFMTPHCVGYDKHEE